MTPLFSFRIFPEPGLSRLYCKVNVWKTRKDMYEYMEIENFDGVCTGLDVIDYRKDQKYGRKKPIFAEMQLCLEKVNDRIVTHEVFHAVWCWIKRRKLSRQEIENIEVEERCAYAMTRMKDKVMAEFKRYDIHIQHDYNW